MPPKRNKRAATKVSPQNADATEATKKMVAEAESTTNGNVEAESPPTIEEEKSAPVVAAGGGRGRKKRKGALDDAEIENALNEQQPSTSNNVGEKEPNSPTPAKRGRKKAAEAPAAKNNGTEKETKKKKSEKIPKKADKMENGGNAVEEKTAPKKRGRKPAAAATENVEETEEEEAPLPAEEDKSAAKKVPKKRAAAAAKAVVDEPTPPSPKTSKATTVPKKTKKEPKGKSNESPQKMPKAPKKAAKNEAKGKKNNNAAAAADNDVAVDGGKESKGKPARNRKHSTDDNDDKEEDEDSKKATSNRNNKKTPMNPVTTIYNKKDFEFVKKTEGDNKDSGYNFKISSWNVAGLRSWVQKDGLIFLDYEQPDILCLQETKCTTDLMPEEAARIPGYHPYWLCKPGGYAGVAIYSKIMPINVEYGIGDEEHDSAGRLITAEYEKFYLVCVYVPNSGRKLVNLESRMRWEAAFQEFIRNLDAKKPVIICGDMNCSHQEIDLANPKSNTRSAGFTKEEREQFTKLLSLGLVDTFRHLYPDRKGAYTYWTYMKNARSKNIGWRLDYFLVSERLVKRVVDNCIRSNVLGSDHCPITLYLKL